MKNLLTIFAIIFSFGLAAQPQVLDGIYIPENNPSRRPVPHPPVNQSSLMWTKRVWRIMDLREKMNHPFYYPVQPSRGMKSLITIVRDGICSGELTAYDPISDEFAYTFRGEEACQIGESIDTLMVPDEDGIEQPMAVHNEFAYENVMRVRIKEDWYFDRHRSVLQARIIGFCPIEEVKDENGEYKGERPLYWVYMPEIRNTLANASTPNRHNDLERRTYDDLFNKRFFSSYVYQESNPSGRKIQDYKQGLDALLEGEKIENKIFDYEQDLWEY